MPVRPFVQRLALSLCTGVIFVGWSEVMFWGRPIPGTSLRELVPTTLVYALAAYVFLWLVDAFQARSFDAVFLAGAAFGWLTEGVLVQTLYEQLPLSISFTGLSWHALLTVGVGWYLVPRFLRQRLSLRLAGLATLVGVGYGLWAIWWWTEAPPPVPAADFAVYAFSSTLILALAYWAASHVRTATFHPSRLEAVVLGAGILAYFALVTVPADGRALWLFPALAGAVLMTLRHNRRTETRPSLLAVQTEVGLPLRACLLLLLIPLAASTVYFVFEALSWTAPTGYVLYVVTVPLGFILFGRAVWRIWRRSPRMKEAARA